QHFSTRQITKATLESITRPDLADFHSRYYYPANFIFAVSGDFETARMLEKLEKAMAGWENRTAPIPPVPKPAFAPKPGIYLVEKADVNQGRVRMGHLGVMMTNPDHIAISIMNSILGGGGFTSRITSRVRSDEGLAYQAGSSFQHGNFYEGAFQVVFQSKSPTVAEAVAIIKEEIERIRRGGVTPEELEVEKNFAIESFPRRFATAAAKAMQFASDDYLKIPEDYWQTYRDRVRALTPADIQRVAQKYLQPDNLVILAVGNTEAILKGNPDRPQFALAKLAPTIHRIPLPDPLTMVYPSAIP
ncbi:MAG: insulinase family protein, partial [Acidobacteria bacterium]|nr:insulinase family protein [Acidobacteriota bacterium]